MFHGQRAGPIYGDCSSSGGDYIINGCGGSDTNVHKVDRIIATACFMIISQIVVKSGAQGESACWSNMVVATLRKDFVILQLC